MCEQCDAVEGVLVSLMGAKPTAIVMKRIRARIHDAPMQNELNNPASH